MSRTLPLQHPASHLGFSGFAPWAAFAQATRRAGAWLHARWVAWSAAHERARQDDQLWRIALDDARVMADLSRAMTAAADRAERPYY